MLKEITAKSMLHHHERTFATNWDANIYRGCRHNCRYCFAQYSHKYLGGNDFFEDIYVKSNAPQILDKELSRAKWKKFPVNVCGVSDCYQPAEVEYKLMPAVIESFIRNRNPLVISTKSTLPVRDIHLIEELNKVAQVSMMTSVSTLDERKRILIEPEAAPTLERLKMLREFRKIGCQTSVLFMPVIPLISDDQENLDSIFRITKEYDLGSIEVWPLHLHGRTRGVFFAFLKKHFPELLNKYRELYTSGNVSDTYRIDLQQRVCDLREKYQLFGRYRQTPPSETDPVQLTLF